MSTYLEYIEEQFIKIDSEIAIKNSRGHYDINKIVEDTFMHILNVTYDWNLKNANLISENFPSVDLIDDKKNIVVQVTSTTNTTKVNHTVKKFKELKKYSEYTLKMFYIKHKPNFSTNMLEKFELEGIEKSDLLDISKILDKVSADTQKAVKLYNKLQEIIISDEKILEIAKKKLTQPNKIFIDYLNQKNISNKELLKACKSFLKLIEYTSIEPSSIEKIVNHISTFKTFPCIVNELFSNDNEEIKAWLNKNIVECNKIENQDAYMSLIFKSKHEKSRYSVTILSKNLPPSSDKNYDSNKTSHENSDDLDIDLSDENSKNEFIQEIIGKIGNSNPKVDLILPIELMNQDINLWEYDFNQSLSRLARVNIRNIIRYDSYKMMKQLIDLQWQQTIRKITKKQCLYSINSEFCLRKVGNNMIESGLASKLQLQKKHFRFIFKTDMSYIVLWLTKDCTFDINQLHQDIENLQER